MLIWTHPSPLSETSRVPEADHSEVITAIQAWPDEDNPWVRNT